MFCTAEIWASFLDRNEDMADVIILSNLPGENNLSQLLEVSDPFSQTHNRPQTTPVHESHFSFSLCGYKFLAALVLC